MAETVPFDLAKYLQNPAFAAEYLDAVVEEGDISEIRGAIRDLVLARGVAGVAKSTGLSREAIYKAFGPKGNPTLATLLTVLKALNLRLSVTLAGDGR